MAEVTARRTGGDTKARALTTAQRKDNEEIMRRFLRGASDDVVYGTPIIRESD